MEKVKLAFIGAGKMANMVHYPSIAEIEEAEFVGICDIDEKKMLETAEKYKIGKRFTDYKKMIEKVSPDAVYIIMPPHHLFDIVIHCLECGINVFIEKPPGITSEQTRRMASLAEKKGIITMVGFQRRFAPVMVEVKKRIEEREGIVQCQANFFKNYINQPPYYNGAVDILTCDAIHAVDILRWMAGEPKKIVSSVKNLFADYENFFCAMIEFESGAIGFLSTNWVSGKRIYSVEMHGKGIVAFVDPEKEAIIYRDGNEDGEILKTDEVAGSNEFFKYAGFYFENKHFIECIRTKTLPETNFSDAVRTMEFVEKIYKSKI